MSASARRRLQLLCRWRGISQVRHLHSCQLPAIASLAWSIHHQTCVCYDTHHPIISDHHLFLIILGWSSLIVNHFWDSIGPGSERSQSVEPGRMEWEISRPWRRLTDSAILQQGEASADTTWRAWGRNSCDLCRPHQWFCDMLCPEAFRLYLYGGLGWWFGSLGNQSYVQNRFEKCVFFVCFVFVLFFV